MKKLRITVEGKVYDVTVEVLEDDELLASEGVGIGPRLAPPAPLPAAVRAASPLPASPHPPASRPPAAAGGRKSDPDALLAPLAGTVVKVFVQRGATIEAKAPVCLLEAMKMETYIYASRTGKVAEVCVEPGAAVQAGDPLIRFVAEG
ncbi:MAG: acetyl-CoA carboxylase biotin carboxyl carrier protein subunit [Deltaproteobacteria bacterium]|nr:acetyl-CoA carboxylase biotin carboxyl carrier protein subunit [Deltaproteobacteria bacterium]